MSFASIDSTALTKGSGLNSILAGTGMFNEYWSPSSDGSWKPGVIAKWENGQGVALELVGSSITDIATTTPLLSGLTVRYNGESSGTGTAYNVVVQRTCDQNGCANPTTSTAKVYLINASTGAPLTDSFCTDYDTCTWTNKERIWTCGSSGPCTQSVTPLFNASDLLSLVGGTVEARITNFFIPNGPVANPNWRCDQEPFFADGNGNGKLDCDTANPNAQPSGGDKSYSAMWEVQKSQMTCSSNNSCGAFNVMPRENAYQFADPVGPKKLLTTAFNGWFDGKHSLSSTTELNALQTFSLIFMFFEEGTDEMHLENKAKTSYIILKSQIL